MAFGWGDHLTRAEKERLKSRFTFLGLSAVLALVLVLIGGTLLWEKVYTAQRAILRVDGNAVSLQAFANLLSYEQNRLEAAFLDASQLAGRPSPPGADPSQNMLAQMGQQRMQQIQQRLSSLSGALPEELIDEHIIRAEAKERGLTATPEEVDGQIRELVGYQDPNATPVPTPAATASAVVTPAATPAEGTQASEAPAATVAPAVAEAQATASPRATAAATRTPNAAQRRSESFEGRYRDYQRYTGGTDNVIRGQVEYSILRRKVFDDILKGFPSTAEQVNARHILVSDEGLSRTVIERLRAGESFEALAAEVSSDSSNSTTGGSLGWFGRGAMVKEFEDAAFALQGGQITADPVKSSFGWHIIRVDERDPARQLEGQALETAKNQALQKWLDEERKSHSIERLVTQDMIDWAARNGSRPSTQRR